MSKELLELQKIRKLQEETNKMLEKLVALQLYSAGATQDEIAANLSISKGKANSLVKGTKVTK